MDIIKKKIDEVIPYINNPRKNDGVAVDKVASSIKEFGFKVPIIIDKDNVIVTGHTRLKAAKKLNLQEVPCIQVDDLTEAQVKAFRIADNKVSEYSEWDNELLKVEFEALELMSVDMDITGFDLEELELYDDTEVVEDDFDEDLDEEKEIISKRGDIIELGNHRLMCGDSTSEEDVKKLINKEKIDLLYTDPPYGINEKGDRSDRGGLTQGNKFKDFKDDTIDYAVAAIKIINNIGIKNQVWWGANYYAHHLPQTANWFVWDKRVEEKQHDTQSDCEIAWVKSKWKSIRIFRHLWKGMMKDSERGVSRVHPTQKPIALASWSIDYFDDIKSVLDLFGGSGSTLIACEQKNITSKTMEFEPHYVDVIIRRYIKYKENLNESVDIKVNGETIDYNKYMV